MSDELKPCPFCGGEAELQSSTGDPWGEGRVSWRVVCKNRLGCQGGACNVWEITPEDASSKWNTRAERTCHMNHVLLYDEEAVDGVECDECFYTEVHSLDDPLPDRCPGCDAKVVG